MVHEEEIKQPVSISSILSGFVQVDKKKKGANSELAATVDEIRKIIPFTKQYGFGFWLKLVQRSRVSYTEMFGILKEINNMGNDKTGKPYNKAGTLVNKLKKLCLNKQSTSSLEQPLHQTKQVLSGKKKGLKPLKQKTVKSPESQQQMTLW